MRWPTRRLAALSCWRPKLNSPQFASMFPIPASAFHRRLCREFLIASSVWTPRVRKLREEQAWASPSCRASLCFTEAMYKSQANRARAPGSRCMCPPRARHDKLVIPTSSWCSSSVARLHAPQGAHAPEEKNPRRRPYMLRKSPRSNSRIKFLRQLAGLLVAGLSFAALAAAQSVPFPTYQVGENQSGTQGPDYPSTLPNPWVASSGQIITPAGTQVYLGPTTRAKAIALNPTGNHTAAVLQMGAPQAVTIFNTITGDVLGTYSTTNITLISKYNPNGIGPDGSNLGISYTPDGKYLLFSQDGNSFYGSLKQGSFVAIAS